MPARGAARGICTADFTGAFRRVYISFAVCKFLLFEIPAVLERNLTRCGPLAVGNLINAVCIFSSPLLIIPHFSAPQY